MIALICKQCGGKMDIDDSQSIAFCSYCGTKHLIRNEVNVTNNYYAGPSDGTAYRPAPAESIKIVINYNWVIAGGAILLLIGAISAAFMALNEFVPGFILSGVIAALIGLALIAIGLKYRRIPERSETGSPNGTKASLLCAGCGNRVDPSSKYCKFCGTKR